VAVRAVMHLLAGRSQAPPENGLAATD
jgi:hypothetical protein